MPAGDAIASLCLTLAGNDGDKVLLNLNGKNLDSDTGPAFFLCEIIEALPLFWMSDALHALVALHKLQRSAAEQHAEGNFAHLFTATEHQKPE